MSVAKSGYWLKSSFYTLGQRFSTIFFNFAGFYLLVRHLPKADYGTYSLFLTVTALIEVARNGLVQNAQIKYATGASKEEYPVILKASITLNIILTALSVVLLMVLGPILANLWKAPILKEMFWLYALTTIALVPFSQFNFIQQANLDFKGIFFSYLVRQGLMFLAIAKFAFIDNEINLFDLTLWQLYASVVASGISWFFVRGYLQLAKSIDWKWVKKLFDYGKFVFATNISSMIMGSVDQMLLGSLLTPGSVATYSAAFKVTNLIDVPISTMAAIVFPQSVKRMEDGGKGALKYLYERSVGVILAMVIPAVILVWLVPEFFIKVIAGDKYMDAIPLLRVTILFSLVQPFIRQFGTMMDSIGKPKLNFYTILFSAAANTIANYILISQFGIMGAAFGTLSALVITFLTTEFILRKEIATVFFHPFIYMWQFYGQMGATFKRKVLKIK